VSIHLDRMGDDRDFAEAPTPSIVLDRNLRFRAANAAYACATGVSLDDLLSSRLFDVFPANEGDPTFRVRRSLERVLATGRPHHLVQRYDLPDREKPGDFEERYWAPASTPLFDGAELIGLLVHVHDLTRLDQVARQLLEEVCEDVVDLEASDTSVESLTFEIENLRRAMESRATIEQAKGIVMADRWCGPDEAFQVLVELSQKTNRKLRDVAAAMVVRAVERARGIAG
jgi:two-component system, response regulator / RNA-binding antiterminator